jgi:ribonuclease III
MGLIRRALTHSSYLNEHQDEVVQDNERLEFLGDAVIDFIAAEWLFTQFPELDEGTLTRFRAGLVRNERLPNYGAAVGIGEILLLGRGEEESGGRTRPNNLGRAFEAVCGALYLDQGMDAVRKFVQPHFTTALEELRREQSDKDAKSRLQEWSQANTGIVPTYRLVKISGPEHQREFTLEALIGDKVVGVGTGRSKQNAAQEAARIALEALRGKSTQG